MSAGVSNSGDLEITGDSPYVSFDDSCCFAETSGSSYSVLCANVSD